MLVTVVSPDAGVTVTSCVSEDDHLGVSVTPSAANEVVLLDEHLAKARLAAGVVLQVEPVEPVERVFVRAHVQRVDVQVVPG